VRTELLKQLLAIPTCTDREEAVVEFLMVYAAQHGHVVEKDAKGNVFMTKGRPAEGGRYPLVCAHTDGVHAIHAMKIVPFKEDCLRAVDPITGGAMGCGGDDKAGVFICLELMELQPVLKAAFFVGEEVYCKGSFAAAAPFFLDVGYCLEFDSPQGNIVSYVCDGQQLFEEDGEFAEIAVPILDSHGMYDWQRHPYTDVAVLKRRFDFTCINLPAGYYHMHSVNEYVNLLDVANAVTAGNTLVTALGCKNYPFKAQKFISETKRECTGLVLKGYGQEQKKSGYMVLHR
jgi:tripeptide aminopeptidase